MNSSILTERIVPFQCYAARVRNTEGPLSGRRRQAARNDVEILDAAREVFLADPTAPVAAVAARAKVGISALYRRYPSKEDLTRELARDGWPATAPSSSAPWPTTATRGRSTPTAWPGSSTAAARPSPSAWPGRSRPRPDLTELAQRAGALATAVHERAQRDGALRADVSPEDVVLLLETLSAITLPGADAGDGLRRRYLALLLQALRAPGAGPLPGRAAGPEELAARWRSART